MPATPPIPLVQRAFVQPVAGGEANLVHDHPVARPSSLQPGQSLVKLSHAGVCHTDLGIKRNQFPNTPKPYLVGGHEGVGIVVAIGDHTVSNKIKVGQRVGIKYLARACLSCEMCLKGLEGHCAEYKTTGYDFDGTFCEYTVAYVDMVTSIPDELESGDAAVIMCAGVTVYSALLQSNTHIGDWIVILGAGGGLGHLAVQYAVAMGLRVVAVDTGLVKRDFCLSLGSEAWLDFKESSNLVSDIREMTQGGAHAVLVVAGGEAAYTTAAMYLRETGTLLVVGLPPGAILSIPVLLVAARGLTIRGVFLGSRQQAVEAVNIAATGRVKCTYTIRGLSELNDVYAEMEKGRIIGRVVLDITK
ncbi:hypothetical protein EW145_g6090 [Phellinidium pouzarii]|uniref:alcohol dehydrogenase n=1 Tax=Phellinidium pouzarii TaxID=167371 RepID=A0A4S4KXS3_9AGAM|nr:hypothetical protein EW145_g6090 [Phellinidium pouzarii]